MTAYPRNYLPLCSALLFLCISFRSDKKAYQLYDAAGKQSSYEKLLHSALEADVILFGEQHNNPICHWLGQELTRDVYDAKKKELVLSAEMFEADDQVTINEYLSGKVSDKTFKDEVKLWSNFNNDYKPLLDFAKEKGIAFVAASVPRRYASLVYKGGLEKLDSIDQQAKRWICPLPLNYNPELKCYKEIYESAGGHGGENLPKSQALKDATMAHFILESFKKGKLVLNFNGSYHSNFHEGIEWYLHQENKALKVFTVASVEQENVDTLSHAYDKIADFTICIPSSMSKSY